MEFQQVTYLARGLTPSLPEEAELKPRTCTLKIILNLINDPVWLLLLLLSCFSRVRLCATPETEAHQAPPSLGFSRQEHWSGLPFPSPMQKSESEVAQSYQQAVNYRKMSHNSE